MAMSKKYQTVKKWWTTFHNAEMVQNAVYKGWITQAEAEEIMDGE